MGSLFVPLYTYDIGLNNWIKFAWIGPIESLTPEPRKALSKTLKREILVRQNNQCRFCDSKITLEPYCNADADHIIPINHGGKTTLENMQLLCVGCHRHKTSLENTQDNRIVYMDKDEMNSKQTFVVYSTKPEMNRPLDMRNPLNITREPNESNQVYVLSYSKRRGGLWFEDVDGLDNLDTDVNIFDQFRYMG